MDEVERVARAIYEKFTYDEGLYGKKPPWQQGGNSIRQDQARSYARAAIAAMQPIRPTSDRCCFNIPGSGKIWGADDPCNVCGIPAPPQETE